MITWTFFPSIFVSLNQSSSAFVSIPWSVFFCLRVDQGTCLCLSLDLLLSDNKNGQFWKKGFIFASRCFFFHYSPSCTLFLMWQKNIHLVDHKTTRLDHICLHYGFFFTVFRLKMRRKFEFCPLSSFSSLLWFARKKRVVKTTTYFVSSFLLV